MDKDNKKKIKVDQEEKKTIPRRILQANRIKKLEEELRKARERKKEYASNDALKIWKKIKTIILRDEKILVSFLENEELFQGLLNQIEEYINKHIPLEAEENKVIEEVGEDDTTTGEYN